MNKLIRLVTCGVGVGFFMWSFRVAGTGDVGGAIALMIISLTYFGTCILID